LLQSLEEGCAVGSGTSLALKICSNFRRLQNNEVCFKLSRKKRTLRLGFKRFFIFVLFFNTKEASQLQK
jgi:hypothetical protein